MPVIFHRKNIRRYFKTIWVIILLSFLYLNACSYRNAAVKAEKKTEQIKIKQQREAEASEAAAKKLHFNDQTKKVRERMKEDEKKRNKYYNKKLGRSFFSILFGKKKRR
jgi:Flp pilus assembly protein TadB